MAESRRPSMYPMSSSLRALRLPVVAAFVALVALGAAGRDAEARPGTPPPTARPVEIVHVVQPGQFLSMLAKRYHTTSNAIRKTNHLAPGAALKPGMTLRIEETKEHAAWREKSGAPREDGDQDRGKGKDRDGDQDRGKGKDRDGRRDKAGERDRGKGKDRDAENERPGHSRHGKTVDEAPVSRANADKWAQRPLRPGFVTFLRMNESFRGQLRAPNGNVVAKSAERIDHLMRSHATNEQTKVDRRLMKLIAQVSDHFGGRPLLAVSGYRPYSPRQYTKNSRHNHGQALDFRIAGVPNRALFEYCLTLPQVGCGFYPNSVFVHLDVRELKTRWVDYSGPGEAPVYSRPRPTPSPTPGGAPVAEPEPDEDDPEPDDD